MADASLHIKDSYFFEVPRALAPANYKSLDEVPSFLRDAHPDATLEQFNEDLSGKILIPQPFARLKNLYEVESGLGISRFMILELVAAFILWVVLTRYAKAVRTGAPVRGAFYNFVETFVVFIRDNIARAAIGSPPPPKIPVETDGHHGHDSHGHDSHGHDSHGHDSHGHDSHGHETHGDGHGHAKHGAGHGHGDGHGHGHAHHVHGDQFVPYLGTLFLFILVCNLLGMLPWLGAPTGAFGTTVALALCTFIVVVFSGVVQFGPLGFLANLVPSMDLHWSMFPIKIAVFAIELLGLLIKHGVLAIRLLANIVAGHLVLVSLEMIVAGATTTLTPMFGLSSAIVIVGCAALSVLELVVCFLQAFVFTFLSALFISSAVHKH
jgi:F-type H+-transporting ATPase subunit a